MKNFRRYIILNLLITSIFSVFIYFLLFHYHQTQEMTKIEKSIGLHQQQLESFINDAQSTVENLAAVVTLTENDQKINQSIKTIKNQESKYKNIYILNKNSVIVNSSSPQMLGKKLKSYSYFNQHINLNNISISGKEKDSNGLDVIYMAKFIPNSSDKMIVVLEIDINALMTVIDAIQAKSTITIKDFDYRLIFQSDAPQPSTISKSVKFQDVNWTLSISSNENIYLTALEQSLIAALIISLLTATLQLIYYNYENQQEKIRLMDEINAQKKELIGMLAANTAHEIKNPLTSIKGFVELLELKYSTKNDSAHFDIIKSEIDRINDIVGQFLLLGRPTTSLDQPIEVSETVKETLQFMRYDLEINNIRLISSYYDRPLYALISTDQLKQVIINLLQNAKDAIPPDRQGIIEVKVSFNHAIFITVRDNGMGMSNQTVQHLFEPFYTTKTSGTGLGLPVTKSIIEAHSGTIEVTSELNIGSTFIIKLPVSSPTPAKSKKKKF